MVRILHTWDDRQPMRRVLPYDVVFVFGSNQRGVHGAGAAEFAAKYFGAVYGIGEGYMGQSYAVPTKDHQLNVRPLDDIRPAVERFVEFARLHDRLKFFLTPFGCGLAGYRPPDVAPMLQNLTVNCAIPLSWMSLFPNYKFLESGV